MCDVCVCLFVASWGWRGGGKSSFLVRLRSQCPHNGQKTTETKVQCRTQHTVPIHHADTGLLWPPTPSDIFFLHWKFLLKMDLVYLSAMLTLHGCTALKPAWLKIELVKWSSRFGSVYSHLCFSNHCSVILFKMIAISPPRCWQCHASVRCSIASPPSVAG